MSLMIDQHNLTEQEELIINDIYKQFKNEFEKSRFVPRKEILGIGEPDKYLFCYFCFRSGVLCVKFKFVQGAIPLTNSKEILTNIEKTIKLFKTNSYVLKRSSTAYKSQNSSYKDCPNEVVANEYDNIVKQISIEHHDLTFDTCSNRLKNALNRNRVYTVGDLVKYSASEILRFSYFGEKCQWELCEFLTKVADCKLQNTEVVDEPLQKKDRASNQQRHPSEKVRYINEINNAKYPLILNGAFKTYLEKQEEYNLLYIEYVDFLINAASVKLNPRERAIFYSRLGINETGKTLQEIGVTFDLTRERIRQIVNKAAKRVKSKRLTKYEYIELEYAKCQLIEKITAVSLGGFFAYLYFECDNLAPLKLMYSILFNKQSEANALVREFKNQYAQYKEELKNIQNQTKYNLSIYNLIHFGHKRIIEYDTFADLIEERMVGTDNVELANFCYDNKTYQCESYLEKKILENFLSKNTFKEIKTQSLKIPFGKSFYYPDFQCLTHDNNLVVIEVKPLVKMCEAHNIRKFEALKEYCEKNGFGYLIIDDRNNSFYEINKPNNALNQKIMETLQTNKEMNYCKFRKIYDETKATIKNLLTLIKTYKLKLSYPFSLRR